MFNFQKRGWQLKLLLLLELLFFATLYIFGGQGLHTIYQMSRYNRQLQQNIVQLQQTINDLELQLQNWRTDDFYLEQLAREQLQMARPQEQIYYLV